jgi:hypothetical protein
MPTVEVMQGRVGMAALLRAFLDAEQAFELMVVTAVGVEDGGQRLLFTIEKTTAAMTVGETRWLSEMLIEQSRAPELERFGRLLRTVLRDAPGPHQGLH